jgi:hypothetical protein
VAGAGATAIIRATDVLELTSLDFTAPLASLYRTTVLAV